MRVYSKMKSYVIFIVCLFVFVIGVANNERERLKLWVLQ